MVWCGVVCGSELCRLVAETDGGAGAITSGGKQSRCFDLVLLMMLLILWSFV